MESPRILIWDIETTPILVYTWGYYQQNALKIVEDWYMLSAAYRWYGEDETYFIRKSRQKGNDKALVKDVWTLLDKADYVVAHNGDRFDQKMANSRFLKYGLGPPSPYVQIDTLKEMKRHFRQASNKMDEVAKFMGLGDGKAESGLSMWFGCMEEDPLMWERMEKYNLRDVDILVDVWEELGPWIGQPGRAGPQANAQQWVGTGHCTKLACGSPNVMRRGVRRTKANVYQTYQCKDCGGYSQALLKDESVLR